MSSENKTKTEEREKLEFLVPVSEVNIQQGRHSAIGVALKFGEPEEVVIAVNEFLGQILGLPALIKVIMKYVDREPVYPLSSVAMNFRELLIRLLGKIFGLNVKVCGNCRHFCGAGSALLAKVSGTNPRVICLKRSKTEDMPLRTLFEGCEEWAPKEVSLPVTED